MTPNNPLKKIGTSFKKKFTNPKYDPGSPDPPRSASKVKQTMDTKESGPSVLYRTTSDMSQDGKESDIVGDVKDFIDNADAKTLVEQPSIARQDTKILSTTPVESSIQGFIPSKREQETKLERVQHLAYEGLKESLRTVERCSDFLPPLKSATRAVLEVIERYEAVRGIPDRLADLASRFDVLGNLLNSIDGNDSIKDRLNGLVSTFEEKAKVIAVKLERSMAARIIESSEDKSFITRELNAIAFAIDIVMVDVNLKVNKNVNLLQESVSELRTIALLDKLKYAEGAGFNHEDRQGCTNGTRIMLLADLLSWATDPENEHVFWLNGMAGTGKTTVAETFCNLLFYRGLLGSSFFCSRKKLDRRNVRLVIPALAKGLARAYPEFQTELLEVLRNDLDFTGLGLEDQYLTLILQPAEKAFPDSSKTIVLVIDALDECEDAHAAEMFLKTVLLRKPTCGLRLLVTSRPEPKILKGFRSGAHASLRLQEIEAHLVKADIAVFLSNKLKEVEDLYTEYGNSWPPAEVKTIVDHAGTLFIYAATALKYISDDHGDPVERLAKFASIRPPINAVEGIDEVYAYILGEAFSHKLDNAEIARVKACLSAAICALEPMSVNTYSILLGITATQVRRAFSSMHSVVQVPESKQGTEIITLYHASFSDYLMSNTRSLSQSWLIDPGTVHSDLGNQCLKVMMTKLHFNIAQASTSYQSNLDQSLDIAPYWNYVAIYWVTHLAYSMKPTENLSSALVPIITQLLEEKYLYWLEVLSVLNKVQVAPSALLTLSKLAPPDSNLYKLCSELAGFASTYLVPIQTSVPHIYLSTLSWISPKSQMKNLYSPKFSHLPLIYDLSKTHGHESLVFQLIGHQEKVTSVAFASNNAFIVSGSKDKTIRVWNAETGEEVFNPLHGHTASITALAISPDSQYIASASADETIRVWDAVTGKLVLKPLQKHTGIVASVVFSSDGKYLLSCSDETVYIWDAKQGGKPLKTFQSSQDALASVAFSPDCNIIATGSEDSTVLLWNASTGQQIGKPLKGHSDSISAMDFSPNNTNLLVASEDNHLSIWDIWSGVQKLLFKGHNNRITSASYSKDGKYIVSGSRDRTVRIWDAETGKEICKTLYGHTRSVTSAAFSGNGKYVASASWDKTVRIWNVQTTNTFEPIYGHSDYIESVVFSHGDQYILSGSRDQTICLWDVKTGDQMFRPLVGHTSRVTSLAVSPDYKYIVSGSRDNTIRVWDYGTGAEVINPIQGHAHYVSSVKINKSGDLIASGSWDETIKLWSLQTGEFKAELSGSNIDFITSIKFSPDEQYIASGSYNGKVCIWNLSTFNLEYTLLPLGYYTWSKIPVSSVAFSFTGTLIASGSWDSTISIHDYKTGKLVLDPIRGHTDAVTSVVYSPNGKYLASASRDNNVCLWDAQTGQQILGPFYGHTYYVTSINFSSDSKYLVSGGQDNMVRLWNVINENVSDQEPRKFLHNYPAGAFTFRKDGWVLTAENELFMWIPPSKMYAVYTPQTNCIFGDERITIDLSAFAHGTSWTTIYNQLMN